MKRVFIKKLEFFIKDYLLIFWKGVFIMPEFSRVFVVIAHASSDGFWFNAMSRSTTLPELKSFIASTKSCGTSTSYSTVKGKYWDGSALKLLKSVRSTRAT